MEKKNILLIDDDSSIADLYRERLEMDRFNVDIALDGCEAMEKITSGHYNLILLDIMMPKIGGLDILAAIKSGKESQNIPVIMLTALNNEEPHIKALIRGADDYIIKTKITPKELVEKIKKILQI